MAFKAILFCASVLLVQSISGQNYGCSCGSGKYGISRGSVSSSSVLISNSGGDLLITSIGPVSPSGISVNSELGLSGDLDVKGALPFLSAVEFQGVYDTKGSTSVCYGCGDGCIGITSIIGGSGSGCSCRK